jgi:predicted MFS family arabinose efflux permease
VALAAGLLVIVLATAIRSGPLYVIATLIAGAGFGVAFLGALRALSGAIPAEHRSSVMSAFYLVAYSSISVPAILAGVLTTPLGLNATFEIFGSAIALVALVVAALAWRTRPQTAPTSGTSRTEGILAYQ